MTELEPSTTTRPPVIASNTRRAATLMAFQIGVMAISLVTGVITARLLGPHDRGVYAVAFIPAQLLAGLVGGGLSEATIYTVSGARASRERVLRALVGLCLGSSLVLAGLLAALWYPLEGNVLKGVSPSVFVL